MGAIVRRQLDEIETVSDARSRVWSILLRSDEMANGLQVHGSNILD